MSVELDTEYVIKVSPLRKCPVVKNSIAVRSKHFEQNGRQFKTASIKQLVCVLIPVHPEYKFSSNLTESFFLVLSLILAQFNHMINYCTLIKNTNLLIDHFQFHASRYISIC